MSQTGPYYHNQSITESDFYKKAGESFLLKDLCSDGKYPPTVNNGEILAEVPRGEFVHDDTRIIVVDADSGIAIQVSDDHRLGTKINIDKALAEFESKNVSLSNLTTELVFNLHKTIRNPSNPEHAFRIETVDVDVLSAIISVCLYDPLDVLFYIWTKDEVKYCQLYAVKPRPKN